MAAPGEFKGQRIGRYELVEHLATGGMAEIFLARQEGEGGFSKDLVLKTLQGRYAGDERVIAMFLDEARLAAKLSHPHVVDIYEAGCEAGVRYIAMEYIQGKTLTEVMRRGIEVSRSLSLAHAAFMIAQAADGLAHMQAGIGADGQPFEIVHRDISPTNLIVSFSGETKIIDFGIAREVKGGRDETGMRPGKVSYMSPEQVQGKPVDGRSDVFSLGTILYEITLRKRLWRGPAETVMRRIVTENPPPPTFVNRDYPADLELCVLKSLAKKPEDRYPSAAALFRDLDEFLGKQGDRTTTRHVARYLAELFAEGAEITPQAARRARAFVSDDEDMAEEDPDALDFDRPSLADTLSRRGPLTPLLSPVPKPIAAAITPPPRRSGASARVTRVAPDDLDVPRTTRRWPAVLVFTLIAAAAVTWFFLRV